MSKKIILGVSVTIVVIAIIIIYFYLNRSVISRMQSGKFLLIRKESNLPLTLAPEPGISGIIEGEGTPLILEKSDKEGLFFIKGANGLYLHLHVMDKSAPYWGTTATKTADSLFMIEEIEPETVAIKSATVNIYCGIHRGGGAFSCHSSVTGKDNYSYRVKFV